MFLLRNKMLPKKNRVNTKTFKTIWTKGRFVAGSFFVFYFLNNKEVNFSFVVPKKIAKNAVTRNMLRRRGYRILKSLNQVSGQGIFLYKKEGITASYDKLELDIKNLLRTANLINNK